MKFWNLIFLLQITGMSSAQALFWNNPPTNQQGIQPSFHVPGTPINIQQLGAQPGYNPGTQPNNIQGIPIGNQQIVQPGFQQQSPFGVQQQQQQQNGIPITGFPSIGNTVQQTGYPINQQFIPQTQSIGNVPGPGPITFPL